MLVDYAENLPDTLFEVIEVRIGYGRECLGYLLPDTGHVGSLVIGLKEQVSEQLLVLNLVPRQA